jgi:hypothetical protein
VSQQFAEDKRKRRTEGCHDSETLLLLLLLLLCCCRCVCLVHIHIYPVFLLLKTRKTVPTVTLAWFSVYW